MRNLVELMDLEESQHRMLHDLLSCNLTYYILRLFYVVRLKEMAVD